MPKTIKTVNDFIVKLVGAYPLHTIPEGSCAEYAESLDKAKLSSSDWLKVLESLRTTCDKFPSLATIWDTVKQVRQLSAGIVRNRAVQLLELEGYQKARYFTMPDMPALPPGAVNARIRILDTVDDPAAYNLTQAEKREAFRKDWIESGAEPSKCDAMFDMIDRQSKTAIADYDDRLTDDEL